MSREEALEGAEALGLFELLRQRLVKEVPVDPPAAGVNWSTVVPGAVVWEIVSVAAKYASSAVAGTRTVGITLTDTRPVQVGIGLAGAGQAPSNNVVYCFAPNHGFGAIATLSGGQAGCTDIPLLPGFTIAGAVNGLDAGDQWSNIVLTVREWSPRGVLAAADWLRDHVR